MSEIPQKMVSVCIPSFNKCNYISETIQSILEQTYPYYRILVVDNASTDNTRAILEMKFGDKVDYFWSEENIGSIGNFNRCIKLAKHDLLLIVCADDLILPDFLEKAIAWYEKYPDLGYVATRYFHIDEQSKVKGISEEFSQHSAVLSSEFAVERLFELNGGGILMPLYNKKYLEKVGGFTDYPGYSDAISFIKIASLTNIVYINEALMAFRVYESKKSTNTTHELLKKNQLFDDHYNAFNALFDWFGPESPYFAQKDKYLRQQLKINAKIITSLKYPLERRRLLKYLEIYRNKHILRFFSTKDWLKLFVLFFFPHKIFSMFQISE